MSATIPFTIKSGGMEEVRLAMQSLWLTGRLMAAGARLWVRHEFAVSGSKPLEVVYSCVLPRDAALRRFRVVTSSGTIESELKPVSDAVTDYEEGIAAGALSTLARVYKDGLVNLNCGNIRPDETVSVLLEVLAGVELHDDGFRFRFPFTLAPSYHPQARLALREDGIGEIELPASFDDVLLPPWVACAEGLHRVGFELTLEMETFHGIASPSHSISSRGNRVALAVSGDVPDRDLVLDVETGRKPFLVTGPAEDGKKHFAGILPSAQFGEITETPRSILVVLDRSGSMEGDPIQQAVAAIKACLALLTADDQIGLITFSDDCTRWKKSLVPATKVNRNDMAWRLGEVRASGGTELGPALAEATKILGPGGEIFLVTDGQVFETAEIVTMAAARGIRVHVLGIGSASQDRFLAQLARQTGGVSRFLTPKERVDEGAAELFAAIGRPVARIEEAETDDGRVLCGVPTAIFSGTPAHLLGTGSGALRLKVDGAWLVWKLDECGAGETIRLLEGARRIADLESREPCDAREAQR